MTKAEKTKFMKQSYAILEQLATDISGRIVDAKEGVEEENNNLIIGSLSGIESTAQHLKNIFETMLYTHQKM